MTLNMRHSSYLILWVAVLAFGRGISAPVASADRGFVQAERATPEMIAAYFSEKTGLYYNCPVRDCEPAASFVAGRRKWSPEFGYGRGMEDCAILTGIALVGAVRRGEAEMAERLARGLVRLSTAHGVPGFVARRATGSIGRCASRARRVGR